MGLVSFAVLNNSVMSEVNEIPGLTGCFSRENTAENSDRIGVGNARQVTGSAIDGFPGQPGESNRLDEVRIHAYGFGAGKLGVIEQMRQSLHDLAIMDATAADKAVMGLSG